MKANLVDASQHQGSGPDGAGLPKAIVDEIELFAAGTLGSRGDFFAEQYIVDGGENGLLHDAWIGERANPWDARIPVFLQAGMYTLPQPVDPETFRDTYQDYTPLTMTVGANPFFFKDPKMGVRASFGDGTHGFNAQLFAGPGNDRQSGLPTTGLDTETFLQDAMGPWALSVWRYDGLRPVIAEGAFDRFERTGFGLTFGQWTRFSAETELINGWDSNCAMPGLSDCTSSGGFEQLRYAFNRRLYLETRYEGTDSPTSGFSRDGVLLLGYGPTENSRVTVEDVIAHAPQTTNTMNIQYTVGY